MYIKKNKNISNGIPGSILVITSALLWSLSGLLIQSTSASISWIIVIRFGTATIVLLPFLFTSSSIKPKRWLIFTAIFYTCFLFCFTIGTRYVGGATTVAVQYTAPLYLFVYHCIKNKEFPKKKAIPMGVIFIGLLFLILPAAEIGSYINLIIIIMTGIFFALYSVSVGKIKSGSTLAINCINNMTIAVLFFLILPFNWNPIPTNGKEVVSIIIGGILTSAISYGMYATALRRIPTEKALLYALCEPVFNPLWIFIFLGGVPTKLVIVGLVFIILGVILDIYNTWSDKFNYKDNSLKHLINKKRRCC